MWWVLENHQICHLILKFSKDLIAAGNLFNKNPTAEGAVPLTMESDIIKKWMGSERVKWTMQDQGLFEKFYRQIEEYQKGADS